MTIQVDLPPYIIKQPEEFYLYRLCARMKYLRSLGINLELDDLYKFRRHLEYIDNWQREVYTVRGKVQQPIVKDLI